MSVGTLYFGDQAYKLESAGLELSSRWEQSVERRSLFVYAGTEEGAGGIGFSTDELPVRSNVKQSDLKHATLHRSWSEVFSEDTLSLADHEALAAAQFDAPTGESTTAIAMFDTIRLEIRHKEADNYEISVVAKVYFVDGMATILPMTASFVTQLSEKGPGD